MGDAKMVDLISLLSTETRDFLVRNDGENVGLKDLKAKVVGLYFSASWCPPCQAFTPLLIDLYKELPLSSNDLEIVFLSFDGDEESFASYFSKMPWLAIPFSDPCVTLLDKEFNVEGIPTLVLVDEAGNVLSTEGVELVREYGVEAFKPGRIKQLKEEEELARINQTLQSLLVYGSRDFVISNDQKKIRVEELEGKMVGLLFTITGELTGELVEIYNNAKEKGEDFEIVTVSLDDDEEEFNEAFASMPWLSLPFEDKVCQKLAKYFEVSDLPRLVIIGHDGKTMNPDATEIVTKHGVEAYPFTPEKVAELAEIERAKYESQTLESVFVSGDEDYVLDKSGNQVPIADLVGKHILVYFSAHWCPPCRGFTPMLIEAYHKIKAKESAFEVIFVSSDSDQASFDDYYSSMPWLALPYGDVRKSSLSSWFKVEGIPTLVALSPNGHTVSSDARDLIMTHSADAFPFTADHIELLQNMVQEESSEEGYICDGDACRKA